MVLYVSKRHAVSNLRLKMDAARSSETLVSYRYTPHVTKQETTT